MTRQNTVQVAFRSGATLDLRVEPREWTLLHEWFIAVPRRATFSFTAVDISSDRAAIIDLDREETALILTLLPEDYK